MPRITRSPRVLPATAAVLAVLALASGSALAWWPVGHTLISSAAADALPADMPEFFRKAGETLAFYSDDPDLWIDGSLPVHLRPAQGPEHFLDLELLKGRKLPATRPEYEALCRELGLTAGQAGALPYAIREWQERLVLAFAEHRKWPDDARVRAKVLYLAGVLAHYTADAAQPLHATVHFDGRLKEDGSSPRSGIHFRMDALPERVGLRRGEVGKDLKVAAAADPFAAAVAAIEECGKLVDKVYELEPSLPPVGGPAPAEPDQAVHAFALERCRAGALLTATLWYSAWISSAKVRLPDWHQASRKAE
jgi:hypothetical protein